MSYIFEKCDFLFNFIGNFVISYILKFSGIYPYFLTFLLKKFLIEMQRYFFSIFLSFNFIYICAIIILIIINDVSYSYGKFSKCKCQICIYQYFLYLLFLFRLFCVIVKIVTIIWIYNIICSSDVWRLYNEVRKTQ